MVQKPPSGTELHLCGNCSIIECVCHCHQDLIILGIEAIQYSLCKLVLLGQAVKELMPGDGTRQIIDCIKSGIGTDAVEHTAVIVTKRSNMELLSPSRLGIHYCAVVKECAEELVNLFHGRFAAGQHSFENRIDLTGSVFTCVESIHPVIRQLTSSLLEEFVTFLQSLKQIVIREYLHPCCSSQFLDILAILLRIVNRHCLVRPPRRKDIDPERRAGYLLVEAQIVSRIIRGADRLDIKPPDQCLPPVFG